MTKPFVVGIPTLNRYDCLEKCFIALVSGSAQPDEIYIIDNGGGLLGTRDLLGGCRIITPQANLGVSGSWNVLHRLTRPTPLILVNDDIEVGHNTLELLMRPAGPCIVTALGWSCFRQDHEVWDIVGDYDENLLAYREDNDYDWRRKIAGVERVIIENDTDPIKHFGSATVRAMTPEQRQQFNFANAKGAAYYRNKWNCEAGKETQRVPFAHLSDEMYEEIAKQWRVPKEKPRC